MPHLLAGTKKGLFLFRSTDREKWTLHGPFLRGKVVDHAFHDARTGRIFAAANDGWFGSEVMYSDDLGETWTSANQSPAFTPESGLTLDKIWHLEPGRGHEKNVVYAGVAPAALFRSDDAGETWSEITGLSAHSTRPRWQAGGGGLCLHSIQVDPADDQRMFIAISAVGMLRTDDGGANWRFTNHGTRAEFHPEKYPEYGQCVHKLLQAPGGGGRLYQQNHCGVYRSDDLGTTWQEITAGLPSDFGFPLALHPRDPDTAYVIPLQGGEFRCPPEAKLRVFRTRDAGATWEPLTHGLPMENAYASVLREGMAADSETPAGLYFGTNTGKIYASRDEGDTWFVLAEDLPPIHSISVSAS